MNYRALTNLTVFKKNMKKSLLALATVLGFAFNASAQGGPGEDNGLGLRLNFGFPAGTTTLSENGWPEYYTVDGVQFGLSLDNRWYVWHNDKVGIAVQGRWLDANFLSGELGFDVPFFGSVGPTIDLTEISGGILGVGPLFTWYLNDDMAIDAYYNVMPAVNYSKITMNGEYDDKETENNFWGIGVTHHVGAAFRWKVLQAGLEYRIGKINGMEEFDFDNLEMDASMNSFRLNLGVKF